MSYALSYHGLNSKKDIDEIIEADNIDELLEQVNDLIVFNLGKEYELTSISGKYQDIYDRIYGDNVA